MQRAGKKNKKKNNSSYCKKSDAKDAAVRLAKETERYAIMNLTKCFYSSMAHVLLNPPFSMQPSRFKTFKRYFDWALTYSWKGQEADNYVKEAIEEFGLTVDDLLEFNMCDMGRYFGPENMLKFFGKDWDEELSLEEKKKVKKAWGNYEINN